MIIPSRQKRHLEQSNSLSMDKDIKEANGNEMFILINALLRTNYMIPVKHLKRNVRLSAKSCNSNCKQNYWSDYKNKLHLTQKISTVGLFSYLTFAWITF